MKRFVIGRDWASWEQATREQEELLPAPDADLVASPLAIYDAEPFAAWWARIEQLWGGRPFPDAVLDALVNGGEFWKHCLRGDDFILEVAYRAYLYRHHRLNATPPPNASAAYRFRNATRLIERYAPLAAAPLGFRYPHHSRAAGFGLKWYAAAPSSLNRLWKHLTARNGTDEALLQIYQARQLVGFRLDFPDESTAGTADTAADSAAADAAAGADAAAAAGGADACRALRLLMSLPPPTASLQLDSVAPSHVFKRRALARPTQPARHRWT